MLVDWWYSSHGRWVLWPKTCVFHAHTRRCHDRTAERLQEKPRKTGSIGIDMWTIKSSAQRASRAREKRTHCNTLYALQMANDRCAHQNCIFGFFKTKFLQFQNPGSDPYLLVFDWLHHRAGTWTMCGRWSTPHWPLCWRRSQSFTNEWTAARLWPRFHGKM